MTYLRLHETPKLGVHQTGSSSVHQTGSSSMPEERLAATFRDPLLLQDERSLHTLRDAAAYITGLPKEQSDLAQRQVTIEALILVARSGPTMLARMAFMKALNRNVVVAFDRDAKKYHWGKHKLKRDQ
jgi:hypothetical protein